MTNELYRRMLEEKRANIRRGLRPPEGPHGGRVAEEDRGPHCHDEFISLQMNGLEYAQLRLIEEALDRIAAGDYGICPDCEQPIPAKRLAALPWAKYCIPCQETRGEANPDRGRLSGPVTIP